MNDRELTRRAILALLAKVNDGIFDTSGFPEPGLVLAAALIRSLDLDSLTAPESGDPERVTLRVEYDK